MGVATNYHWRISQGAVGPPVRALKGSHVAAFGFQRGTFSPAWAISGFCIPRTPVAKHDIITGHAASGFVSMPQIAAG